MEQRRRRRTDSIARSPGKPGAFGCILSQLLCKPPPRNRSSRGALGSAPAGSRLPSSPALCADPREEAERCSSVPRAVTPFASPPNCAGAQEPFCCL